MRKPEYVSPTQFFLWKQDREEYFKRYLSNRRFEKEEQTIHMGIGGAFDYQIKKKLCEQFGMEFKIKDWCDNENIREKAQAEGERILKFYIESGAYTALLSEIAKQYRYEFSISGIIEGKTTLIDGAMCAASVPLAGRPDAAFLSPGGRQVILDWKVNSWLSARTASPKAGYIDLFPVRKAHRDAMPLMQDGIMMNGCGCSHADWMTQISIYGWLIGSPVGEPIVGAIDQIVGHSGAARMAKHRFLIGTDFQLNLFRDLVAMWEKISQGLIFDDLSANENRSRCEALELQILEEKS